MLPVSGCFFYPLQERISFQRWKGKKMGLKKKKRLDWAVIGRTLLILLVVLPPVALLGTALQRGYWLYQLRQERVRTENKVQQLKAENDALAQEKENLGDIKYIEKVARDEHNMVGKNEIPLFMVKK